MIDFQNKALVPYSVLVLVGILLMAGAALYSLLVPVPVQSGQALAERKLTDDAFMAKVSEAKAKKDLAPKLWYGDADEVSAGVLAQISEQASKKSLKLDAFHAAQRPTVLGAVTELPYSVQISGPYPSLRAVMAALDAPSSKIILRSVQIASSEQSSNVVAATLGVSAYVASDPLLTPPSHPAAEKQTPTHKPASAKSAADQAGVIAEGSEFKVTPKRGASERPNSMEALSSADGGHSSTVGGTHG